MGDSAPRDASSVGRLVGIDHVQLAMPRGREDDATNFYEGLLGLTRVPKPAALEARGGCWFVSDAVTVHVGVEESFAPARKAHPAFGVSGIDVLAARLEAAGTTVTWDYELDDVRRCYVADPFGNRIELIAMPDAV
jgi:catechol 2,3-dioxygenase-like lactoylglutathione lyase family enzyme